MSCSKCVESQSQRHLWSLQAVLMSMLLTLNVNIMFKCSESQSQYHFRQPIRTWPYADSQCHALNVLNLKVNHIYGHFKSI